ncbi:MAG TPA: extracellular solute-binding protein [Candidatus Limnocylindrales bacterium]|nr:extracellular solute-binding protein [Candidatus Limnocylindrales bacterium]
MSLLIALLTVIAACADGNPTPAPDGSQSVASGAPASDAATPTLPEGDVALTLWIEEGDSDSVRYMQGLADAYTAEHPNVSFEVINKDVDALPEEFEAASAAGDSPELLLAGAERAGRFTSADLLLPLDTVVDRQRFVPAAADAITSDGTLWGAPLWFGNQLMLYWNKELAGDTAPANSDEWVAKARELTKGDQVGIAFNQNESFWLVPFLGGFGGSVFADDGVTPTLDSEAMRKALQFLYDLKFTAKVTPQDADYREADELFRQGRAAYSINGDWTLGAYAASAEADPPGLGDDLGVGPLPSLVGGADPKPFIAGMFLMASKAVGGDPDVEAYVADFVDFATGKQQQVQLVGDLRRLPANVEAIGDPVVTGDRLLAGAAEAAQKGVPQPTNVETRCVFDAMDTGVREMFAGSDDFAALSAAMQSSAQSCIDRL